MKNVIIHTCAFPQDKLSSATSAYKELWITFCHSYGSVVEYNVQMFHIRSLYKQVEHVHQQSPLSVLLLWHGKGWRVTCNHFTFTFTQLSRLQLHIDLEILLLTFKALPRHSAALHLSSEMPPFSNTIRTLKWCLWADKLELAYLPWSILSPLMNLFSFFLSSVYI